MNNKLKKNLQYLAQDRLKIANQKAYIAELESVMQALPIFEDIQNEKQRLLTLTETASTMDGELRTIALEIFDADTDKNKTICPEVKVTENTIVSIDDKEAARAWASLHSQESLQLNATAIKKVAKVMPVDGISISKENRVRIGSDLSAYLPEVANG